MDLDVWAGVLNMRSFVTAGIDPDAELKKGVRVPDYVTHYKRPHENGSAGSASMPQQLSNQQTPLTALHLVKHPCCAITPAASLQNMLSPQEGRKVPNQPDYTACNAYGTGHLMSLSI